MPDVECWDERTNRELIDALFGGLMETKPEVAKDFICHAMNRIMGYLRPPQSTPWD